MDEAGKAHEDIAFIRSNLEDGRAYARLRSPDFAVWGLAAAFGYLGTYAHALHLWSADPRLIWYVPVAAAWAFSLRNTIAAAFGRAREQLPSPAVQTLRAVWRGFGITAMLLALVAFAADPQANWFAAVTAGMLGLCFHVSAAASGIGWLRNLAYGWWGATIVLFLLRDSVDVLPVGAASMILLLFLPGLVLWLRRPGHG
ncbi:MAG: hypothetical protein P4L72_09970 [Parvibaculum sp.]|uniref:hypothetical protein n=1 Tax=Parvibaculum sp. TaxID=2024848 RepID=UPI00283DFB60|nr:hypothetical protein [Parvibaculum sp.]MDR3499540.1 hypothetical protein [Parvibaculum sp.]